MPFSDKQIQSIIESNARMNIWDGSVRSGKTFASIFRWIEFVKTAPTVTGSLLMCGKTHKALQRNVLEPITQMLGKRRCRYNRGTGEFFIYGRKCDLIGANDERSQDQIRGATVYGAYCDEITLYPESFFKMLLSRLSLRGSKLFGTTNPDSPYHWLKIDYLDRADELDLKRFQFVIDDNINLDPDYVRSIKKEYTGIWYKRFIEGLWVLAEGIIYDMIDEDKHFINVSEVLNKLGKKDFSRHFVAVDHGTANPFAAGLFGYDSAPPCYMQKEYYFDSKRMLRHKTDRQYALDLKDWLGDVKPSHVFVDPNARSFHAELRRHGFNVIPAENSVIDGLRFVGSMLSQDLLFFDKSCQNTKQEAFSYVWDIKKQEKGEDAPLKKNDHAMDMVRYGVFTNFFKLFPMKLVGFNFK